MEDLDGCGDVADLDGSGQEADGEDEAAEFGVWDGVIEKNGALVFAGFA